MAAAVDPDGLHAAVECTQNVHFRVIANVQNLRRVHVHGARRRVENPRIRLAYPELLRTDAGVKVVADADTVHVCIAVGEGHEWKAVCQKFKRQQGVVVQAHFIACCEKDIKCRLSQLRAFTRFLKRQANSLAANRLQVVRPLRIRSLDLLANVEPGGWIGEQCGGHRRVIAQPVVKNFFSAFNRRPHWPQRVVKVQGDCVNERKVQHGSARIPEEKRLFGRNWSSTTVGCSEGSSTVVLAYPLLPLIEHLTLFSKPPMPFKPETPFTHGAAPSNVSAASTAVLLCNLGTPDAPTAPALRRYLAEFLSDSRVVEIPRPIWWLILHGIILRVRPKKSAAKYASVWMKEGSPLKVWTEKQALMLRGYLAVRGHNVDVRYAMRYGSMSIGSQLAHLKADGVTRVLIMPAYPQYSATTTASVFDAVYTWAAKVRRIPEFRFVNHYHDEPGYIKALAASVRAHWMKNGQADKLVMSFHGVPQRTLMLGDPYHCECHKTARLVAEQLGLAKDRYMVTFQSRFGRAKWLEPYTEPTLIKMAHSGLKSVDMMCPGFTGDCLETLEEINMEAREAFLHAGGKSFSYIPCLNDSPEWISALADFSVQHLAGWPTGKPDAGALASSVQAAKALGAHQ